MPTPFVPAAEGPTRGAPVEIDTPPQTMDPPTATATPGLDPACLNGAWQVANLPEAMAESYAQSQSGLHLEQVEGQVIYEFYPDGGLMITYHHLATTLSGSLDDRPTTAQQAIDGSATAHYQLDPARRQIELTQFGGDGIVFSLQINGQTLAEGDLPLWRAFTSSLGENTADSPSGPVETARAAVDCQGDRLTLQAIQPLSGPPVQLERVQSAPQKPGE